MSQKWRRAKQWDDLHLTGALLPVKWGLRTLSSITLAVITLAGITLYGTMASIPIGLLAQIPTWGIYLGTLLAAAAVGVLLPMTLGLRGLRRAGVPASWRYSIGLLGSLGLAVGVFLLWKATVWPHLRWNPATGEGLMLFSDFVAAHQSTTLRRLPGFEMSELEFYGWWPMKAMLLLLVVNLVVATVRRIEFIFVNIGVLTVHTGIVVMAIGSVLYSNLKLEGDTVLFAGPPDERGEPTLGPPQTGFYDNTDVALWVAQHGSWQQRLLTGVPRYNDYALDAAWPAGALSPQRLSDAGRTLRLSVPPGHIGPTGGSTVDPDLRFEVVGYASYADGVQNRIAELAPAQGTAAAAAETFFAREITLTVTPPSADGNEETSEITGSLIPTVPAQRLASMFEGLIAIEHTRAMSEERWRDMTAEAPAGSGATNLLTIEVPAAGIREVVAVQPQGGRPITVGDYTITVDSISPAPPFPIITPGYEGATSSVAIVTVDPVGDAAPFQRWIYHRFPELNQDLHPGGGAGGQPRRTDADPSIRIGYVDLTKIQIYLDEREDGSVRAAARLPGGRVLIDEDLGRGELFEIDPRIGVRLGAKEGPFVHAPTPRIVPEDEREAEAVGTHRNAMLAVRIWSERAEADWEKTLWLPFVQYMNVGMPGETDVALPDGRQLRLAFGRIKHTFPGFALALRDFEMIPYPHSDVPRDYRSDLLVWTSWNTAEGSGSPGPASAGHMARATSLNEPFLLRVPFQGREDLPALSNFVGRIARALVPVQFKFSQAGWDRQGWMRTLAETERGERMRPAANWTILGVGNNPGIYIIAFGAVLTCAGIPWAFYIKPLLVRRRKMKIKKQLAQQAGAGSTPSPGTDRARGEVLEVAS